MQMASLFLFLFNLLDLESKFKMFSHCKAMHTFLILLKFLWCHFKILHPFVIYSEIKSGSKSFHPQGSPLYPKDDYNLISDQSYFSVCHSFICLFMYMNHISLIAKTLQSILILSSFLSYLSCLLNNKLQNHLF